MKGATTMRPNAEVVRLSVVFASMLLAASCTERATDPAGDTGNATIANHTSVNLASIPQSWIEKAKTDLRIAYGHTSHGSQIIDGMNGLISFKGPLYSFNSTGTGGGLALVDNPFIGAYDLGNPDRSAWAGATRTYLNQHSEINVVVWSWCGEVSNASPEDIDTYLSLMSALEKDFPGIRFVYMTGHLDGTGLTGNLHLRNEQIRSYCQQHGKLLYDFADIESHNPDGVSFADKSPNDNCDYDSDGNGSLDRNWAVEWQNAHPGLWYSCGSAHSQPLNANMKAYAAWHLWARIAGWNGM